jgi:hypothetical protein
MRRFTAIAAALTMLLANVARANASCESSSDHRVSQAEQSLPHHEAQLEHGVRDHENASQEAEPPCEEALERDCCQALASCSTMFSAEDGAFAAPTLFHDAPVIAISRSLPSRSTAPEPPPPKA